jgi:hypothetical protein
MKLTLYLLFGSEFISVGILAPLRGAGVATFSFLTFQQMQFDPALQTWGLPGVLRRLWHPRRYLAAAYLVARRPCFAPTAVSMLCTPAC